MRITKFSATGLNGYLNFDLDFGPSRTFLVGINGSGKTSVLKAIMGLVGPDIDWLMSTEFTKVSLSLISGDRNLVILASRSDTARTLSIQEDDEVLGTFDLTSDAYTTLSRNRHETYYDGDGELVRMANVATDIPTHIPVFNLISELPKPIFLGLDRSNLPFSKGGNSLRRRGVSRRTHPTIRSFLDESVAQAESAASDARLKANIDRQKKASELRENMLLTLFLDSNDKQFALPKTSDVRKFETYRKSLKQAFSVLGLNRSRVDESVDPFFSKLIGAGSQLSRAKDVKEVFSGKNQLSEIFSAYMNMSPRLQLFAEVEKLVNAFNADESAIFAPTNSYLRIMDSFFTDSNKRLLFLESGALAIALPGGKISNISVLSSGERQLLVLITTLMFGDEEKPSSILIIDEPELSLHLKWQESFVEAIAEANPSMQLIFATHSPSIILDQDQYCVDLA